MGPISCSLTLHYVEKAFKGQNLQFLGLIMSYKENEVVVWKQIQYSEHFFFFLTYK